MESAKQKVKDMASGAKEKANTYQAKAEEKTERATGVDKDTSKERRKAKEAEAEAELHSDKAHHAADKHHSHLHVPTPGHHGLH